MAIQPNIPIVNAGLLYVNSLTLGTENTGDKPFIYVSQGAARDDTNTNDIISNAFITLDGHKVGVNGVDVAPIVPNEVYAIFVIGDSNGYQPTAVIASLALGPALQLPYGYNLSRRIGWAGTNAVASPNTGFLKWYQSGAGSQRKYYYDVPVPILIAGSATGYSIMPNTLSPSPGYALPPINGTVILQVSYTANSSGNSAQFTPFASYNASLGNAGIIRIGGGGSGVSQNATVEVPCLMDGSSGKSVFYYRVSANDQLTLTAIGFYDDLY